MKINSGDNGWDNVKESYLDQVEKCLMRASHSAKNQVLEDVSSHLDQKYAELGEDDRTWESYQQIITEMGPAEDYAELLGDESVHANNALGVSFSKYLKVVVIASIALSVICWFGFLKFNRLVEHARPKITAATFEDMRC